MQASILPPRQEACSLRIFPDRDKSQVVDSVLELGEFRQPVIVRMRKNHVRGEDDRMLLQSPEDRIKRPVDEDIRIDVDNLVVSFVEERFEKGRLYVGVELQYIVFKCDRREVRNT